MFTWGVIHFGRFSAFTFSIKIFMQKRLNETISFISNKAKLEVHTSHTHNQGKQGHVYQNLRVINLMAEKHDFSVC